MTNITTPHSYRCDLNTGPCDAELRTPLMYQDALADEFRVAVYRGDDPVDLTGMTVHGSVYYASTRQTRGLVGSVDGHYASVTLDADCYKLPGLVCITIQLETAGGVRHTVLKVDGLVVRTRSEALLSGGPLPSLAELVEMIKNLTGGTPAIPEYVETEAMSVLDKVIAAQGSRTFTLAAITDMHYGSSDYIEGVIHAVQGMKHISDRIKLDAVAVLGDYTDEHQMDTDTAVHDLEECNALLDPLRHNINLRLKGNHDHRPDKAAQIYRYITAYSDGVVWGDKLGGYYYRDFEDYKLRVICLNTTEVARSNLSVSAKQYNFFIDALNLSAKSDAAEWSILLLSHHPLDFTVTDGYYRFGSILNAYKNGVSWSDGTHSCDFTGGKNAATLICNIHGHLHNLLTAEMYIDEPGNSAQIGVYRMCTPAARVDYVNHYSSPWAESQWYDKTMNTANDTSFCIYCVDLDAKTVKAFCYGAGYDRALTYEGNGSTSGGESGGGSDTPTTVDNWLPISTDANGNVYNGTGYKANTRYSASSNAESAYDGIHLSGYIPVEQGSVVELENVGLATTSDSARVNVVVFGTDMTTAWEAANVETLCNRFGAVLAADGVTVESFVIPDEGTHYIRINATYLGADSVVQVQ